MWVIGVIVVILVVTPILIIAIGFSKDDPREEPGDGFAGMRLFGKNKDSKDKDSKK